MSMGGSSQPDVSPCTVSLMTDSAVSRDRGGDQDQSGVRAFSSPESLTYRSSRSISHRRSSRSPQLIPRFSLAFGGFPLGTAIRVMPAKAPSWREHT